MAMPSLLSWVIESQGQDTEVVSIRDRVRSGMGDEGSAIHTDGSLWYKGRVMVPQLIELREEILRVFHCSRFAVHPGGMKMYRHLHHRYYWRGMKRHVGDFVRRPICWTEVGERSTTSPDLIRDTIEKVESRLLHSKITHLDHSKIFLEYIFYSIPLSSSYISSKIQHGFLPKPF